MRTLARFAASVALCLIAAPPVGYSQMREAADHETVTIEGGGATQEVTADVDATALRIVEMTNAFREEQGLETVAVDETLTKTAQAFATYMAENDRYGHQADGRRPADRARAQGYEIAVLSENIAYLYSSRGYETEELATKFVQGWIDSPPHRENMVDPDVTQIGVGVAQSDDTKYYYGVQMFGRPAAQAVRFRIVNKSDAEIEYQIAGRTMRLPPRYGRSHKTGRPPTLTFVRPEGSERQNDAFRPVTGDEFVVTAGDAGEFVVTKETGKSVEVPSEAASETPPVVQAPQATAP